MTEEEIRAAVLRAIGRIAPEADLAALDPRANMRDQLDIDSVDFLNFAIGLNKELGVDIPDADLPKLASIDGCVAYLLSRAKSRD